MRGAATLLPRPTPGAASRATRRPHRLLLACALISALGHAALLVNWQDDGGAGGAAITRRAASQRLPEPVTVATVQPPNTPTTPAVAAAETRAAEETFTAATATEAEPTAAPAATPVETRSPPPTAADADIHADGGAIARSGIGDGNGGDSDGDERYLSRNELDRPPAAQADIELPFPDTAPLGSYRAVLMLFIDSTGQVQRVRTESAEGTQGASLPPSLDNAARQAFLAARFTPGAKDGQPVRSRIRVEVVYSTELLARQSASAAAAGGESAP